MIDNHIISLMSQINLCILYKNAEAASEKLQKLDEYMDKKQALSTETEVK